MPLDLRPTSLLSIVWKEGQLHDCHDSLSYSNTCYKKNTHTHAHPRMHARWKCGIEWGKGKGQPLTFSGCEWEGGVGDLAFLGTSFTSGQCPSPLPCFTITHGYLLADEHPRIHPHTGTQPLTDSNGHQTHVRRRQDTGRSEIFLQWPQQVSPPGEVSPCLTYPPVFPSKTSAHDRPAPAAYLRRVPVRPANVSYFLLPVYLSTRMAFGDCTDIFLFLSFFIVMSETCVLCVFWREKENLLIFHVLVPVYMCSVVKNLFPHFCLSCSIFSLSVRPSVHSCLSVCLVSKYRRYSRWNHNQQALMWKSTWGTCKSSCCELESSCEAPFRTRNALIGWPTLQHQNTPTVPHTSVIKCFVERPREWLRGTVCLHIDNTLHSPSSHRWIHGMGEGCTFLSLSSLPQEGWIQRVREVWHSYWSLLCWR